MLITDPAAAPVRPTLDVDAIIKIASYSEFTVLEDRLRQLGFRESHAEGAPICRWLTGDLILDLMPTDPAILGFSNRWYGPALEHSEKVKIDDHEMRVITAPYFVATKLEAFHGRGKNDFSSHDLEDIVTVTDGRPELMGEFHAHRRTCRNLLANSSGAYCRTVISWNICPAICFPIPRANSGFGLIVDRMRQLVIEG